MKRGSWFALLFTGVIASAQDPTAVSLSQNEAMRDFPALREPDSHFNRRFLERYKSLKAARDSLLLRDDWPEVLAKEIGVELGISPAASTVVTSAPDTPAATPTPWKPLGTMLDQKPGDDAVLDKPPERYRIIGTVLRKVDAGLMVSCAGSSAGRIGNFAKGIVLLKDAPMYGKAANGDPVKCWGIPADNYPDGSVAGSGLTVHSYEYSQ